MDNLEDLLALVGNANLFQVILVVCLKTPVALVGWTMMEMSFMIAEPQWCCVPKHVTETPEEYCHGANVSYDDDCHVADSNCSLRLFDDDVNTIVNEWNLVCDEKWKANLSISVQMAGVLVGSLITGLIADFFGRKKTFFVSISTLTVLSLVAGFSTSWEMFMVLRTLLGLSSGVYLVVSIPYMMEFLGESKRHLPSLIPVFSLGTIAMVFTAWSLRDWRWIHWVCAAALAPLLPFWFFIPESLRWLTVKGRLDEAEKVVAYIACVNKKEVPEGCRTVLEAVYAQERSVKDNGKKSYTYLDIYRGWNLFKLSVTLQVIWFSFSFCGYGIAYGASTLGLSLFVNMFLMSTVSLPGLLFMTLLMPRFGRKTIGVSTLTISTLGGFASLAVYLEVSDEDVRTYSTDILCLVSLAFLSAAWVAVMVINNESYPTVLRSLGYGAANTTSRIGGILAPFAFDFKEMPVLAYALIGATMGLCALLLLVLDETKGQDLKDTMKEAELTIGVGHEKQPRRKTAEFKNGAIKRPRENGVEFLEGQIQSTENQLSTKDMGRVNNGFSEDVRF